MRSPRRSRRRSDEERASWRFARRRLLAALVALYLGITALVVAILLVRGVLAQPMMLRRAPFSPDGFAD
jgi:hypothetical protein